MVMLQVSSVQNRGSPKAVHPDPHLRLSNQNLQGWPQSGILYCLLKSEKMLLEDVKANITEMLAGGVDTVRTQ